MTAAAVLDPARLNPHALRHARRAAGVSLDQAAAATGRTASVVARYERGVIDPPASVLGVFAGLYRVEVGAFYTGGDR